MSNSFTARTKKKQSIRLVGKLSIVINGQEIDISDTFRVQTDLAFTGLTTQEQDTMMQACDTSIAGKAEIHFIAELVAEEIKTKASVTKEPTALEIMLSEVNKPTEDEMLEAALRDEIAKGESSQTALNILGIDNLPETKGE